MCGDIVYLSFFFLYIVIVSIFNTRFISISNIINILQQCVPHGLIALGGMIVIISGGIDLSAGFTVSFTAVMASLVFEQTASFLQTVLAATILGALVGLANGLLVTRAKIQPFITTLATMLIVQGVTLICASGKVVFLRHPMLYLLGKGTIMGIPISFIVLVISYLLGYFLLTRTKLIYVYAIGCNEESARLAGINIDRYKTIFYVLSGLCAGIASVAILARISMMTPTIGGIELLLNALASVIIGGTSLAGGKGTVGGHFLSDLYGSYF